MRQRYTAEQLKQDRLNDDEYEKAHKEMVRLYEKSPNSKKCQKAEDKYWDEYFKRSQETEQKRYDELPKFLKELHDVKPATITIWSWMYPWNHPCQPKEYKDTLTLLGDGCLQCRFDPISLKGKGKFKVLQKVGVFLNDRSPKFKSLKEGQILHKADLRQLAKELV